MNNPFVEANHKSCSRSPLIGEKIGKLFFIDSIPDDSLMSHRQNLLHLGRSFAPPPLCGFRSPPHPPSPKKPKKNFREKITTLHFFLRAFGWVKNPFPNNSNIGAI